MKIKILLPMCFLGKGHGTVPLDVFLSFLRQQADFLFLHGWTYPAGHDALEEIQRLLLILSVKSCHAVLSDLFSSYLSSVRHLPYVFRRKSTGFPPSCSAPLFLANVVSEC